MPARTASFGERMCDLLAVDENLAGIDRIGAEDRRGHLRAAGAHQAGEAEDLALADAEADIADFLAATQAPDLQRHRRVGRRRRLAACRRRSARGRPSSR